MGIILRRAILPEETINLVEGSRSHGKDHLKGTCTTPSCDSWHPPCTRTTKQRKAAGSANGVLSNQRSRSPAEQKRTKNGGRKGSVASIKNVKRFGLCISGRRVADDQFDIAVGSKILEIEAAPSVNSIRGTFYDIFGRKGLSLEAI